MSRRALFKLFVSKGMPRASVIPMQSRSTQPCNRTSVESLRIIAGLAIIGWGLYARNWFGAIGAVPLLTALIGWCKAYLPFGLSPKK